GGKGAPRPSSSPTSVTSSPAPIRFTPSSRPASSGRDDCSAVNSLCLDVRRLDDRPPLLDLGAVMGEQRLRGLILARGNLLAELSETLTHTRIGQSFDDRGIELIVDDFRRAFGRPNPVPDSDVQSRH